MSPTTEGGFPKRCIHRQFVSLSIYGRRLWTRTRNPSQKERLLSGQDMRWSWSPANELLDNGSNSHAIPHVNFKHTKKWKSLKFSNEAGIGRTVRIPKSGGKHVTIIQMPDLTFPSGKQRKQESKIFRTGNDSQKSIAIWLPGRREVKRRVKAVHCDTNEREW